MNQITKDRKHHYQLPNGNTADNMKDACEIMGLGAQGFRALVRKGVVKKVNNNSKTEWYDAKDSN